MESYGTAQVRALTMASRAFFAHPPAGFSEHPLISPRGAMMVATHGEEVQLAEQWDIFRSVTPHARLLSSAEACALVPVLRPEKVLGAVLEPDAAEPVAHWPATVESPGSLASASRPLPSAAIEVEVMKS